MWGALEAIEGAGFDGGFGEVEGGVTEEDTGTVGAVGGDEVAGEFECFAADAEGGEEWGGVGGDHGFSGVDGDAEIEGAFPDGKALAIDLIEVFGEGPSGEGSGDGVSGVWERGTKDDAHGLGITGIEIAAGEHEEIAGIFLEGVSDTDEIFWGKGGF